MVLAFSHLCTENMESHEPLPGMVYSTYVEWNTSLNMHITLGAICNVITVGLI